MLSRRRIAWVLLAGMVATGTHANAQGLAGMSAGGIAATEIAESSYVGWYADAFGWVMPGLGVVGEASGYYNGSTTYCCSPTWHAALGGLRLDTRHQDRPAIFGQLLAGLAIGEWGEATFAVQPGLGLRLPLNDRWALRIRADARVTANQSLEALSIGIGVSRSFRR